MPVPSTATCSTTGTSIYSGKVIPGLERFEAWRRFKAGAVFGVDWHGRIFEVTSAGEIAWEYVNPYFFEEIGAPGLNNWMFRAFRYTPTEIAAACAA